MCWCTTYLGKEKINEGIATVNGNMARQVASLASLK